MDHTDEAVINTKYDYSKPMIIDASDAFDSKPDGDKLYAYARKVMTPLQKDAVENTINFTVVLDPDSEEAKTLRLGDRVRAKSIYTGTDQKVRVTKLYIIRLDGIIPKLALVSRKRQLQKQLLVLESGVVKWLLRKRFMLILYGWKFHLPGLACREMLIHGRFVTDYTPMD